MVTYKYDTWGKLISTTGTLASTLGVKNPYRYRGYRYDTETGLYYLQSRYYDPEWGRFINADTILGQTGELLTHNIFAYCLNNPVNMTDPSGFMAKWLKTALKITVAVAAVAAITTLVVCSGGGAALIAPMLVSGLVGGSLSAASDAVIQKRTTGQIGYGRVALNFAGGYASGNLACAANGGIIGQGLSNAGIGFGVEAIDSLIDGKKINKKEILNNSLAWGIGGFFGGPGVGYGGILGKELFKNSTKSIFKSSFTSGAASFLID